MRSPTKTAEQAPLLHMKLAVIASRREFPRVNKKPPPLAFQAWPDYLSCGDFADLFKGHCHEHDMPKNACIIDVCFGDAKA